MKIKIERSGEDLWLPLPDELIERYGLKEGDEFDGDILAAELGKLGYDRTTDPSAWQDSAPRQRSDQTPLADE